MVPSAMRAIGVSKACFLMPFVLQIHKKMSIVSSSGTSGVTGVTERCIGSHLITPQQNTGRLVVLYAIVLVNPDLGVIC